MRKIRNTYEPKIPEILKSGTVFERGEKREDDSEIVPLFPHLSGQYVVEGKGGEGERRAMRVGVVLSGGQAAGGHNVITGLFDCLKNISGESKLFGFLDGPSGIVDGKYEELTEEFVAGYRNTGGFDMIGAGRTKIESDEQLEKSLKTCQDLKLDGIVVIGGDDSNTNAAVLAEYLLDRGCQTKVIGVPKTIDGDLRNDDIAISFGFDTACKTYSEMIGNIGRDALSAKKYTHFIKLMGRSASHIALECALHTQPNVTLISEEIAEKKQTLEMVTKHLADVIEKRGKNYGVIILPEGLIEFMPDIAALISQLNDLLAETDEPLAKLTAENKNTFDFLPEAIQNQLLLDRDPHGNVQVSHIQTERLLMETVARELKKRNYSGKFSPVAHFFGYEGRSGFPSNFDANYTYALGFTAARLLQSGLTGYIACVRHLKESPDSWAPAGIPLTSLMRLEIRHGKQKPVIEKALVTLDSPAFKHFESQRDAWETSDDYLCCGPIQFAGPAELTNSFPLTL